MPEGTDLIVWSPRLGDTGDDRYLLPSGRAIRAGATPASNPTISEVNGYTDVNQLVGERRRQGGTVSAVSAGQSITRGNWPYNVTMPTAGVRIKNVIDAEVYQKPYLRKALATDCQSVSSSSEKKLYEKRENAYPPNTDYYIGDPPSDISYVGQYKSGSSYRRDRMFVPFAIPSGLPTVTGAKLNLYVHSQDAGLSLAVRLAGDLGAIDSTDWNAGTEVWSGGVSSGWNEVSLTSPVITPGTTHYFVFLTTQDRDGVAPTGSSYIVLFYPYFIYNFGMKLYF